MNDPISEVMKLLTGISHLNLESNLERRDREEQERIRCLEGRIFYLEKELNHLCHAKYIEITLNGIKITAQEKLKMSFSLQDIQEVVLTAAVLDAAGKTATLVATPVWASTTGNVSVVGNGLSATVTSVNVGSDTVTFSVDGVSATFDITVTGGAAASATITAGTPTAIPAPAPAPAPVDAATPTS